MKRTMLLVAIAYTVGPFLFAQSATTLALWDFSVTDSWSSSTDLITSGDRSKSHPTSSTELNRVCEFYSEGGVNRTTLKGQNGYAFLTNWHYALPGGSDQTYEKWWVVKNMNTVGYFNLTFECDLWSSNTGPRDYVVEYQVGSYDGSVEAALTWVKVGAEVVRTTASQSSYSFPLPTACAGKTAVSIRVKRASLTQCGGAGEVASGGQGRIDNIKLLGYAEPTSPMLYTSVSAHTFCETELNNSSTFDFTLQGKILTPLNAPISLQVAPPFSVNKSVVNAAFGQVPATQIIVSFAPSVAGEYNEQLVVSGGSAPARIITLRGVSTGYTPSKVTNAEMMKYKIYGGEGWISISNSNGLTIYIYSIAGTLLKTCQGEQGALVIPMNVKGTYIIRIGTFAAKIIL